MYETKYGTDGDRNPGDFPASVVEFVHRLEQDDTLKETTTDIQIVVRDADSPVGAEVYVREHGNEGLWIDESGDRPTMEGSGSRISKRVQDLARNAFGEEMRVTQYEDDTHSETTITPTRTERQRLTA